MHVLLTLAHLGHFNNEALEAEIGGVSWGVSHHRNWARNRIQSSSPRLISGANPLTMTSAS